MYEHTGEIQKHVDRLAPHGRAVWEAIQISYNLDAATRVLALQVCRLVDRLDRLEAALKSNKTWLTIAEESEIGPGTVKIVVQIDSVLAEARQQAVALTQILHKLGVGKLESAPRESSFDETMRRILEL